MPLLKIYLELLLNKYDKWVHFLCFLNSGGQSSCNGRCYVDNGKPSILSIFYGSTAPSGPGPPHYRGFTITLRHTTIDRTPLEERSARRRNFYLKIHNTKDRQSCPRRDSNLQSHQVKILGIRTVELTSHFSTLFF